MPTPADLPPSDGRSDGSAGPAGALALYGSPGSGGDELWTVRGRNYSLTLVRAGTVLSKEDLNRPKGEKWEDFTFNEIELNRELENTRKKHGDQEFEAEKVNMDLIPSLYDLIQQGQEKKRHKRADTWCRVAEFVIFLVCMVLFYMTLSHNSNAFVTFTVGQSIALDVINFSKVEQTTLGVRSFYEVTTSAEYNAWLLGPLQRILVNLTLRERNLFVLAAVGRIYRAADITPPPLDWCPRNATTNASQGCYPDELKSCLSRKVIDTFKFAQAGGDQVPRCQLLNPTPEVTAYVDSFKDGFEFSFIRGKVSSYAGSSKTFIGIGNVTAFMSTIQPFLPNTDSASAELDVAARMLTLFLYSPSLNSVFIYQLLIEQTLSGSLATTVKSDMLTLSPQSAGVYAEHVFAVLLAVACFLMQLRRILGCPQRFTFEDKRDACSCWALVFILLPVLLFTLFVMGSVRFASDADTVVSLSGDGVLTYEAIAVMFRLNLVDTWILAVRLATLVIFNACFFRYLLMYFPQLAFVTAMVRKLAKPLLSTLFFLTLAFLVFGVTFFALYSTQFSIFRNLVLTTMQMIRFAQGRFTDWYSLYQTYATMWTVVMTFAFVIVTLVLNNLAAAIMLSHKKEKDLFENYSYHPCWASERNKGDKDPRDFNPAKVGWDFSGREPRPPPE